MPLIIMCGGPCSGKTTYANKLKEWFQKEKKITAKIVSDFDVNGYSKNKLYSDSQIEKVHRSSLKSIIQRCIGTESLVILDSPNYIKGYRYELFCISKSARTNQCLVWCNLPEDFCKNWNSLRAKNEQYDDKILEELIMRFEIPESKNRWDSPLFPIYEISNLNRLNNQSNNKSISDQIFNLDRIDCVLKFNADSNFNSQSPDQLKKLNSNNLNEDYSTDELKKLNSNNLNEDYLTNELKKLNSNNSNKDYLTAELKKLNSNNLNEDYSTEELKKLNSNNSNEDYLTEELKKLNSNNSNEDYLTGIRSTKNELHVQQIDLKQINESIQGCFNKNEAECFGDNIKDGSTNSETNTLSLFCKNSNFQKSHYHESIDIDSILHPLLDDNLSSRNGSKESLEVIQKIDYEKIYKALFCNKVAPPHMATLPQPLSSTNFLHELDVITQSIIKEIMERQKECLPGDLIKVEKATEKVEFTALFSSMQLQRFRRQFINFSKSHTGQENANQIANSFVCYLNKSSRD